MRGEYPQLWPKILHEWGNDEGSVDLTEVVAAFAAIRRRLPMDEVLSRESRRAARAWVDADPRRREERRRWLVGLYRIPVTADSAPGALDAWLATPEADTGDPMTTRDETETTGQPGRAARRLRGDDPLRRRRLSALVA